MNKNRNFTAAAVFAAALALTACGNKSTESSRIIVPHSDVSTESSAASSVKSTQQSTASTQETPVSSEPIISEPPVSEPYIDKDAYYILFAKGGGTAITGGENKSEEITIAEEMNGRPLVSISGKDERTIFPNARRVTLPNSLTEIDDYAFAGCADLEEINIPPLVEEIGEYAFRNCVSLTKIEIPSSTSEIEDHAFDGCERLAEITLAEGVREIGAGAFRGCAALKNISLPDSVTEVDAGAFDETVNFTVTYRGGVYTRENINDLYDLLR